MKTRFLKFMLFSIVFALIITLQPGIGAAAQEKPLSLHLSWVDTSAFPTITVHFSAWDQDGVPLAGLGIDNFILQEDGGVQISPQQVLSAGVFLICLHVSQVILA